MGNMAATRKNVAKDTTRDADGAIEDAVERTLSDLAAERPEGHDAPHTPSARKDEDENPSRRVETRFAAPSALAMENT